MAKKNVAIENTEQENKKTRTSIKDKARAHITRLENRQVLPAQYGAVLEAFAAIGLVKYDETLDMVDHYTAEFMANLNRGNE